MKLFQVLLTTTHSHCYRPIRERSFGKTAGIKFLPQNLETKIRRRGHCRQLVPTCSDGKLLTEKHYSVSFLSNFDSNVWEEEEL